MNDGGKPRRPAGLGRAGRVLWASLVDGFDFEPHELVVVGQACRVADRIAALDRVVDGQGVTVADAKGDVRAHPALVESRQQRITLARLLAVLRLPDEGDVRPQRRPGVRGAYGLQAVS
ncbi:MAG TPA: hypothetical protein VFX60_18960 [Micromonospora sp.]|nr:hypothetical protein [Micromonospora sp.]